MLSPALHPRSFLRKLPLAAAVLLSLLISACTSLPSESPSARTDETAVTTQIFDQLKSHPVELRMFLQAMPKGGDLHNHLSGAVYAESYLDWALEEDLCLNVERARLASPPCTASRPVLSQALSQGMTSRDALVNAWSLRNFIPASAGLDSPLAMASGHDQFFATFLRFDEISGRRAGEMLAEVVARNDRQNIGYLELMKSFQAGAARRMAQELGLDSAGPRAESALREEGLDELVTRAIADIDEMERVAAGELGCSLAAKEDCPVTLRYIAQVLRTVPPAEVLAQTMVAFALAERDPRVVAVNLVAPEDNDLVLKTYEEQMRIVGRLAEQYPDVGVTLHAGELTLGLVPPRDLSDHIHQAVEVAGATRIGHGIDISYESAPERLLRRMAEDGITVEINLTSNAEILGVEGREHPFQTYRRYDVPVVLSTDDEGVSRNDLTHEYLRAVDTYDLDYGEVKHLARQALEAAFLFGESLWQDLDTATPVSACRTMTVECRAFLEDNERARHQLALEQAFQAFETERAALLRQGIMPPLSAYGED